MQAAQKEPREMNSPDKQPTFFSNAVLTLDHLFPWVFWALGFSPLLMLMGLGFFTRYLADDYSTAGALRKYGFWQAQSYWYHAWSGRFSFTFLVSLVELVGVAIVPWLPVTALLILLVGLIWTLRQFFTALGIEVNLLWVAFLADAIVFGTIKSLPEFPHVIFWQTGILTYQISIIIATIAIGVFIRRFILSSDRVRVWELAVWWLVIFISGGFSETWVVIQISLLGLAFLCFVFTHIPQKKAALLMLTGGFVVSWLALFIIAAAPGNLNRDTVMAELSFSLLKNSLVSGFLDLPRYLLEWLGANTLLAVLLLLAGLTAGLLTTGARARIASQLRLGALLLFNVYILMWAGFVPQFAVMNERPQERAIFMPLFLLLWAYVLFGFFLGIALRALSKPVPLRVAQTAALVGLAYLLVILPVRFSLAYYKMAAPLSLYSLRWDARDVFLRQASAAGQKKVVAESLRRNPDLHAIQATFWIDGDLQDQPDHWINEVAAHYYGLESITLHYPGKFDQYQSPG